MLTQESDTSKGTEILELAFDATLESGVPLGAVQVNLIVYSAGMTTMVRQSGDTSRSSLFLRSVE